MRRLSYLILGFLLTLAPAHAGTIELREEGGIVDYPYSLDFVGCGTATVTNSIGTIDLSACATGSGDITGIGDVASGEAFNGTQGTTLIFEGDAGANFTLSYNSTTDDFEITDDLNIIQVDPHVLFDPTTSGHDSFELYTHGNIFYLTKLAGASAAREVFRATPTQLIFPDVSETVFANVSLFSVSAPLLLDNANELRFGEGDANGSNYLAFVAPSAVTSNFTCTLENDSNPIPDSCVGDGTDGGGSPTDATYVTLSTNATLTDERVLTAGTAIGLADGGAGSTITLNFVSTGVGTTTWGSGSSFTWTFDAGATKPVLTASSGDLFLSTGTLTLTNTGLHLLDSNASHDLIIREGSDLTADQTLILETGDSGRTITLNGNPTLADWFDQSVKMAAGPTFATVDTGQGNNELYGMDQNVLTTSDVTFHDLVLSGSGPDLRFSHTGSDTFHLGAEAASLWFLSNSTDGRFYLTINSAHQMRYGDSGVPTHTFTTDGTGDGEVTLPASSIGTSEMVTGSEAVKEFLWMAPSTLPLQASDSIAPLTRDTGTNLDQLVAAFDDSTDECRFVQFVVPSDVDTSGTSATFKVLWYPATASTSEAVWDVRWVAIDDAETWDASLTTDSSENSNCAGTAVQDVIDECTWTETLTTLGWTANDLIEMQVCRDANHADDALTGDALLIAMGVSVPRT